MYSAVLLCCKIHIANQPLVVERYSFVILNCKSYGGS